MTACLFSLSPYIHTHTIEMCVCVSVDVKNAEHCTPISSEVILSTCQPILISFLNGIDVVIETNKAFTMIYIKSVSVLVFFFFFF